MKYLRRFDERISIYNPEWEKLLPSTITVLKGQDHGVDAWTYKKGNVMLNADMIQISYDLNVWGAPDTFEIDIYMVNYDSGVEHVDQTTIVKGGTYDYDRSPGNRIKNLRLDVDITFGDMMACEFSISKNGIKLIQNTTYGSKFDPTNTVFAIEEESLIKLIEFFNRFNIGKDLSLEDFHFLRSN